MTADRHGSSSLLAGVLCALLCAQGCSRAAPVFKPEPGLWEYNMAQQTPAHKLMVDGHAVTVPARTLDVSTKACLGKTPQKTGLPDPVTAAITDIRKGCAKVGTQLVGATLTQDVVCDFGEQLRVRTHSITTFQYNRRFHLEQQIHVDSPNGSTEGTSSATANWLSSACPAGMKPGDARSVEDQGHAVSISDGQIVSGRRADPSMDALSTQYDKLIRAYVSADSEILHGLAKLAEAVGRKELAQGIDGDVKDLDGEQDDDLKADFMEGHEAYMSGAWLEDLKSSHRIVLNDEAKAAYAQGLEPLAHGVQLTAQMKDDAASFLQAWQVKTREPDNVVSVQALARVAEQLPEHTRGVLSTLQSALAVARRHDIPVPAAATMAAEAATKASEHPQTRAR